MGMAVGEPQHEQEVLLGHWQLGTFAPGKETRQQPKDLVDRSKDQIEDVQDRRDPGPGFWE